MTPKRIQRKRTKGWRKPPNTVCVDRSSRWGNPYKIGEITEGILTMSRHHAVSRFEELAASNPIYLANLKAELRGKNLCCYCPIGLPCHADVMLKIANEVPKCAIDRDSKDDDCGHLNKVSSLPSKDTKKEGSL